VHLSYVMRSTIQCIGEECDEGRRVRRGRGYQKRTSLWMGHLSCYLSGGIRNAAQGSSSREGIVEGRLRKSFLLIWGGDFRQVVGYGEGWIEVCGQAS
jgi:hypothetical protein